MVSANSFDVPAPAEVKKFHPQLLAAESVSAARTALGTEQHQLVQRELALVENAQKLLTHGAAGTYNSYFHLCFLSFCFD